jgi:hypothetical protein
MMPRREYGMGLSKLSGLTSYENICKKLARTRQIAGKQLSGPKCLRQTELKRLQHDVAKIGIRADHCESEAAPEFYRSRFDPPEEGWGLKNPGGSELSLCPDHEKASYQKELPKRV